MSATETPVLDAAVNDLKGDPLQVAVVAENPDCYTDYVRYQIALGSLTLQHYLDCRVVKFADLAAKEQAVKMLAGAHVVLFRGAADPRALRLMEHCRAIGQATVIDIDDDLWNVHPCNPAYVSLGTREYHQTMPDGSKVPVWVEGDIYGGFIGSDPIPFDIERNLKALDKVRYGIEMADLITTTTPRFARKLKEMNPNVAVLPNPVDTTMWKVGRMPRPGYRIGWQGGDSHLLDLQVIAPAIARFLHEHKDAIFVVCGFLNEKFRAMLPPEQIEVVEWQAAAAYPWMMMTMGIDHALAPLTDDPFNVHKSPLKWCEYGAMGVACSASKVAPYSDFILHGQDGWLVKDGDWYDHLEWVYRNPLARKRVGLEARATVERDFSATALASKWLFTYRKLREEVRTDRNPTVNPFLGGPTNAPAVL